MNLNWKEILKKAVSIIGKLLLALGILYIIVLIVLSLLYRPMGVKVTNVTSSSATVTWYTSVPMTGVVKYKEKDSFLPWIFGGIGSQKAYDDRDFANAQTVCVEKFNENIEKEVDSEFTVSGEDFDCENIKIKKVGRYYVHHVTVKNLKESSPYYFRVGDRLWSWKGDMATFTTYETPNSIKEPMPIFGRIVSSEGNYSSDSIIFTKFSNRKGETSVEYSSVSNSEGGWYIDGGNLRSSVGEIMEVVSSEDSFTAYGRYKASGNSESVNWIFGSFDGAYPDLEVKYTERDNWLYKFVFGVNAASACTQEGCDVNVIGYGNCAKKCANESGGTLNGETLKKMGLCSDNKPDQCAGNFSAITGQGVTGSSWGENQWEAKVKKNNPDDDKENGYWVDIAQSTGSSGGTDEGSTSNPTSASGDISITVSASGNWVMNFGGVEIKDSNSFGDIIDLEDPEIKNELTKCRAKGFEGCKISIHPVKVNLLSLLEKDPKIEACIKSRECVVGGLSEALDYQVTQLDERSASYIQAKAKLEEIRKNYTSVSLPSGYSTPPPLLFTGTGSGLIKGISDGWMDLFNEKATLEDKKNLAMQLGLTVDEVNKINFEEVYFDPHGNTLRLIRKSSQISIASSEILSIPLSAESYSAIMNEKSVPKTLPVGYTQNPNVNSVQYSGGIDSGWIDTFNDKADSAAKREFAKSLGVNIPKDAQDNSIEFIMQGNKVVVVYRDKNYNEKKASKTPPSVLTLPQELANNLVAASSDGAPIVVNSSTLGESDEYLANVDPADFNNTVQNKIKKYENCQFGQTCTEGDAKELVKILNSQPKTEGVYIVVAQSAGPKSKITYTVKYLPNSSELDKIKSQVEAEKKKLESLIEATQSPGSFLRKMLLPKTYAAEKKVASTEGFVFYLPEYGLFSLSLGDFEFEKDVSDGATFYIFYLETNGKEGFQMPKDPDNPTIHEDIMVRSKSFEIQYEKKAEVRKYELNRGINIISFDFIPVGSKTKSYSAGDLIENADRNGTRIEYVSYFDGGRWVDGYKCTDEGCVGTNFTILPGRGYLLKTANKGSVSVSAYNLKSAIPLNLSAGWNLVGVHGYGKAYTAKTLIESVNTVEGLTADNVSWYPTSKGRYEGLQVTEGVEYGFDYPINPMNGYFVRVKEFAPEEDSCRSIIWHEGNTLHGTCGDSKSLF